MTNQPTDAIFERMLKTFAQKHPQTYHAYCDLTDAPQKTPDFPTTLKKLWFEACISNDKFNPPEQEIVRFMRQSTAKIPEIPLKDDEKQMLTDLMQRHHEI